MLHTKCAIADSDQYGPVLSETYVSGEFSCPFESELHIHERGRLSLSDFLHSTCLPYAFTAIH